MISRLISRQTELLSFTLAIYLRVQPVSALHLLQLLVLFLTSTLTLRMQMALNLLLNRNLLIHFPIL